MNNLPRRLTFPQALQWCRLHVRVNSQVQIMHMVARRSGIQIGALEPREAPLLSPSPWKHDTLYLHSEPSKEYPPSHHLEERQYRQVMESGLIVITVMLGFCYDLNDIKCEDLLYSDVAVYSAGVAIYTW